MINDVTLQITDCDFLQWSGLHRVFRSRGSEVWEVKCSKQKVENISAKIEAQHNAAEEQSLTYLLFNRG